MKNVMGESLKYMKILVVGDIMLDRYVIGEVERISPEAPVPVVHVQNEYSTLGGCGNTVRNIRELGPQVFCLFSISDDVYGQSILKKMNAINAIPITVFDSKETIVKERVIAHERQIQMIRIDRENIKPINPKKCIEALYKFYMKQFDIIVISDYAKGMITEELMDFLKNETQSKIIIDPKPENIHLYNDVYMITPNIKEYSEIVKKLFPRTVNLTKYTLITEGSKGMTLIDNVDHTESKIKADPVEVYNVSGAGDTVISIMAVCLSMGWSTIDSAYVANKCAAHVVTQPGTSIVPQNKFIEIVQQYKRGDF